MPRAPISFLSQNRLEEAYIFFIFTRILLALRKQS
jgi:hypothetical protein